LSRAAPALAAAAAWALFALLSFSIWKELPAVYPLDGEVHWALARAFLAGDNPYAPENVARYHMTHWGGPPQPPTCALWFLPLAAVPLAHLNQALGALMIALLAGQLVLIGRALRVPHAGVAAPLLGAVIVLQGWFVHHLGIAQISQLIAFLLVLAWYWLRRERQAAAGAAVGLACTLKLFPGALLPFLLVTGRRRALAAAAAVYLAVAGVVTARFGASSWRLFFAHKPLSDQWVGRRYNASLEAMLLRLTHPGASGEAPFDGWVPAVYPYLSLAILGAVLWAVRRTPWELSFALVACVGTFLNPWVWPHYDALLALPALLAAAALHRAWPRPPLAAALAFVALLAAQSVLWLRPGARPEELASWTSWPAIIVALAVLVWRSRDDTPLAVR
jgi:alpha-1,2-mannosyltransferase